MNLYKSIECLCNEHNISITALCKATAISRSLMTELKMGRTKSLSSTNISKIANYFNVSIDTLVGNDSDKEKTPDIKSNAIFLDNKKIHMIPLFESVSAGFGAHADSSILDYVPIYISDEAEARETLCIRVCGDSMYPKIENGDIIQVHKQASVDSGSIAVVLLDGEEGLVKRVEYGPTWIELYSINPMYPVQRFEGPDVQRLQVVGIVRKIIKEV